MGEKPAQIEHEIEVRRERIGRNIQDLQHRVADMKDWRKQFQRRPGAFIGLAFGAGFIVSLALRNGNSHAGRGSSRARLDASPERGSHARGSQAPSSQAMDRAWQTLENVKSALVGLAASKFTTILSEAIPGFQDEYGKCQTKTSATYAL